MFKAALALAALVAVATPSFAAQVNIGAGRVTIPAIPHTSAIVVPCKILCIPPPPPPPPLRAR
jgi:hypothetical protein